MITAKDTTTFEAAVQHSLTRAPIVTLGGKGKDSQDVFSPNINMGFSFKGETEERFINLNQMDKAASTSIEKCTGGIIVDKTDQYLIDAAGNLKWNFILPEKPKSPRIRLAVAYSAGTEFLPQGTLEDDWKTNSMGMSLDDYLTRHNRPIDIIDSLAVYIDKKNNEYKTGKIGHWHRIIMYDKAGNIGFGWYEWVSKYEVHIVLDEKYLEAVEKDNLWPVLVDPTFGYDSIGATEGYYGNFARYCLALSTPAGDGTLESISVYTRRHNPVTPVAIKLALYEQSDSLAGALIVADNTGADAGTDYGWVTLSMSHAIVGSTQYWLGINMSPTGDAIKLYYDSVAGAETYYGGFNQANFPDPATNYDHENVRHSIYATYTTGGGTVYKKGILFRRAV